MFKGLDTDKTIPKLVRTSKDDQNHAAAFDYELLIPNQWASVTIGVNGQPGKEGALPSDDVSGYKFLSIQTYVTGTSYMRVEVMSTGPAMNLHSGHPMTSFKLKEGFNTYKVRLSALSQPAWVEGTRSTPRTSSRSSPPSPSRSSATTAVRRGNGDCGQPGLRAVARGTAPSGTLARRQDDGQVLTSAGEVGIDQQRLLECAMASSVWPRPARRCRGCCGPPQRSA